MNDAQRTPSIKRKPEQSSSLDRIVKDQLDRLQSKGVDLAREVANRTLPDVAVTPAYLVEAMRLSYEGDCNAVQLSARYRDLWNLSPQNAMSYATLALGVLRSLEVAA